MENNYNFKESEKKLREFWEKNKIYKFDINSKKPIYSCDTPPPTVSGTMHMGHALAYSQADFIMRYRRMMGFNIFYPWGFDDNGLATERFVEKKLGVKGEKMSRPEFISLCLKETKESEEELQKDWAALGISPDWDTAYRTISPDVIKISQKSFIDLYVKGREYRKEAPTIWCTKCQTAIAQVEMEDKQDKSTFNYIKAKLEDGSYIIFATTRPELFPANVGYSVKRDGAYIFAKKDREIWVLSEEAFDKFKDEWGLIRFGQPFLGKKLIGKKVTLPLLNNTVEITHDVSVKTEFGTGTAYFCTYGGLDDIEWVARHNTAPISIINRDGTLNGRCGKYKGMTLKEARKLIIEDLKKEGMLIKVESIDHALNVHDRCGTEVEYIVTTQWFIRYLDLKDYFLEAGNKLNWHPKYMQVRYENWVKGLQWDWCISRQRFFGVPFPVWYCKKCGKVMLADETDLPVDPTTDKPKKACSCGSNEFEPEKDVLDTWATSSLTPMIATKWGSDESVYNKISPMSLRNNGHDIITFWLFNTVVKSLLHEDKLPWKDVMINGFVLDPHGRQMHKSKGNAISPLEFLDKYGADALRFWAASSKLGSDIRFQEKEILNGSKTIKKLWNASKFCFSHLENYQRTKPENLEVFDQWILSKLSKVVKTSTEAFEVYDFSVTKSLVEIFFWKTFCDNYLEIIKDRVYNPKRGSDAKLSAQYTMHQVLLIILKLFAPIMPHITEEIFQVYYQYGEGISIHTSEWPVLNKLSDNSEEKGDLAIEIISRVRQFKSKNSISLKVPVRLVIEEKHKEALRHVLDDLKAVTNAEEISYGNEFGIALKI